MNENTQSDIQQNVQDVKAESAPKFDIGKYVLPAAILIAAVMVSGALLYTNANKNQGGQQGAAQVVGPRVTPLPDDDPALGSATAKVTVIEFSDYQCPFCRRFWKETLPQIKKDYIDSEKIRFVYRDFPLSIHPGAEPAAQAAQCAGEEGEYWEFHDKSFSDEEKKGSGTVQFSVVDLKSWAGGIGLNTAAFNQCLDSGKYKAEVEKDLADGTAAGVTGTPTFFINGKALVGAQPYAAFQTAIEEALK